ncbi:predicted protein [Sclerotinia sclerotiorum 1980 UF-70]|uniref:Uncharacterized protein n=1 Tax=Sclerotinia sclerotiorum (strain ATCC 18683 / 1980 / Ss-1) TaxID=665079 RepID=A7EJL1_SCLS1|nr:predicted protein [Sclerotinia sclerotiorum 1980 UF-70]EDO03027.1 predicted protein [Sclerotinia sclerotiorum 1980 UF-70]
MHVQTSNWRFSGEKDSSPYLFRQDPPPKLKELPYWSLLKLPDLCCYKAIGTRREISLT